MREMTLPESSLFLLLLSADVDADLNDGGLTAAEEELILKIANKWEFYDEFYSQEQMEAATSKYGRLVDASVDAVGIPDYMEHFIGQCAQLLVESPPHRDMTYYLCLEILFLSSRVEIGSREMDLVGKLADILKVDPAVDDFVFGLERLKATLNA